MRDRITRIIEGWYIVEPALFQVICTHDLVENASMTCPVRSGRRRIEYNPAFIREMSDEGLEEALRAEAVRLLLKHPYERKPDGCGQQAVSVGSDAAGYFIATLFAGRGRIARLLDGAGPEGR